MSKYVEEKINELRSAVANTGVAIDHYLDDDENGTFKDFDDYCENFRYPINCIITEILLGSKIKHNKKNELSIKFSAPLPTMAELSEITMILDQFINEKEIEYLSYASSKEDDDDEDDLSIEDDVEELTTLDINFEKICNKSVRNSIPSIAHVLLSPAELPEIAAIGVALRSHNVKKTALIIGGLALSVVAGTAGVVAIKKHNDNKDDVELIESDDIADDSVDDADIDTDIDSDAPVVELDA